MRRALLGLGIALSGLAGLSGTGALAQGIDLSQGAVVSLTSVVGAAFEGRLPAGIRVTTKHRLGTPPAAEVEGNIVRSLEESLARMRLERVDLFFLHSNIIPDDYDASAYTDRPATRWTTYLERFVPVCERVVAGGRIGAWGITGIGIPECVLAALGEARELLEPTLHVGIDAAAHAAGRRRTTAQGRQLCASGAHAHAGAHGDL